MMVAIIAKKNEKESRRPTKTAVEVDALVATYPINPGKPMEMIIGKMITA
jgi:hypothetical protein